MATRPGSQSTVVCFGEYELDLSTRELRTERGTVDLQEQPFHVLAKLLEQPGELVAREKLTKTLWPSDIFVDFEHSLNKAVNRLREALGDSAENPRFIETLPRRGYRFIAPVTSRIREQPTDITSHIFFPDLPESSPNPAKSDPSESHLEANQKTETKHPLSSEWKNVAVGFGAILILVIVFRLASGGGKTYSPNFNLQQMQITKLTNSGKTESVAISADGRYVAYSRREPQGLSLWLHQVATHGDAQILPPNTNEFEGLSFSPDSNYIYFVRAAEDIPDFRYLYVMPVLGGRRACWPRTSTPQSAFPRTAGDLFTPAPMRRGMSASCGSPTLMEAAMTCSPRLPELTPAISPERSGPPMASP